MNEKNDSKKSNKGLIIGISFVIFVLMMMALAFSLIYYYSQNTKKDYKDYNNKIKEVTALLENSYREYNADIEYATSWNYEDFLKNLLDEEKLPANTKINITIDDAKIEPDSTLTFNTIGEKVVKIIFINNLEYTGIKSYQKEITTTKEIVLKVVDTKYPILSGIENKTITAGDSLDILSGITATDEVDGNLEVKYEGEVDLTKAGTYTLKIYAEDKNGNRTEQEMTINVNAKKTSKPSSSSSSTTKTPSSSSSSTGSSSSNQCATSSSVLTKRGYKPKKDPDACQKDKEASAVAKKIADEILAKGYTTDIDKVDAAAEIVSSYYYKGVHVESGFDYRTAYGVFIKGEASCAGCTRALMLVLEYMGFTNLVHANENGYTHQWVILEMDGQKGYADGQVGWVGYGCHMLDETCMTE